ncbi:hypothetical protein [Geodermatophilus sp. CPCC 206100]|uniref:hypothetical protein n=1 Tax=Geodermatophilus sp. CPCC 206100 TaxID=3020054 RepID=UPI003B000807
MTGPLAEVFPAAAPRPELADRLAVFAPLVGSWQLRVTDVAADGTETERDGEWHFGWALDGRALADVWISPSRAARAEGAPDGEWGMSLRFWDEALGRYRSTWLGPARGWVIPFTARPAPDGLVLEGEREGTRLRWVFSELGADSFRWRAEEDEGAGPRVRQRFAARRVPAP